MRDEKEARCEVCGTDLAPAGRGRPARYCSRSCQARAYRARKRPPLPEPEPQEPEELEGRRREIAGAVWRIAAGRGLHEASMREIAAEAGVSLRSVQYHFGSKHQLLVGALKLLHADNERRACERIDHDPGDPRALLNAILEECLPLDEERRFGLRVLSAYYSRSLTDPALAAVFLSAEHPLEDLVAWVIGQAQEGGACRHGLDARHEADLLVSGAVGLGGDMLHGRRGPAEVTATLGYHLDRIFEPRAGR
ncbi:TetR/AcrR family transcriptional regulator [Streptomyces violascens]|uniref:TetR/AcrR family transcriptional regulator n=1 Tax=Streptomyces violascens TaxID=67381 RepID=UPI001CFDD5E7|nr:TetR/AcrR family transcriptional regulator [Streptomyces violascens]